MSGYTLRLIPQPYNGIAPGPAELGCEALWSDLPAVLLEKPPVYNTFRYKGELICPPEGPRVTVKEFTCNYRPVELEPEREGNPDPARHVFNFRFNDKDHGEQIFIDFIGYVFFTVKLELGEEGSEKETRTLHTALIPVYMDTREETAKRICGSIAKMADYLFEHCELFWREDQLPDKEEDDIPSLVFGSLKPSARKSLEDHIQLLRKIVRTYKQALPYFRTGSKYRVRPEKRWVNFEQASYLSSDTFRGILQRADYLMPDTGGIQFPDEEGSYVPTKVIAAAGQVDYGIYENRYVVGFLRYLVDQLDWMARSLDSPEGRGEPAVMEGWEGPHFLQGSEPQRLERAKRELTAGRLEIAGLYTAYRRLLSVAPEPVHDAPRATAIFRSVRHYQGIYDLACQWFRFGVYDFKREDLLLPFVEGHKLYEYYVLIKLLEHCAKMGFELISEPLGKQNVRWKKAEWGLEKAKGQEQGRPNLFHLQKGELRLTLFYEPRIFSCGCAHRLDELELFRSDVPPCSEDIGPPDKPYKLYKPDYVVKLQKGEGPAYYLILDAKFSNLATTKKERMEDTNNKYLNSLRPKSQICGLCLLYGKPGSDLAQDNRDSEQPVTDGWWSDIKLIALRPENEGGHTDALNAAMALIPGWKPL